MQEEHRALSEGLAAVAAALERAHALASPYASFGANGEPLDPDAEVVALCGVAQEALPLLEAALLGPKARALAAVLEEIPLAQYKDHLYNAAIEDFEPSAEESRALENKRRYEGALEFARALGVSPDEPAIEARAEEELVEDLRREIPELRGPAAAEGPSAYAGGPDPWPDDPFGRPRRARLRLNLDEAALDALLARRQARESPGGEGFGRWNICLVDPDGILRPFDSSWRTREVALLHLAGIRAGSYGRLLGSGPTPEELAAGELRVVRADD